MYAGPYPGLNVENKHVDITLKHALAAIKLTTRRGSYEGPGAIISIGLGGYCGGYNGNFDVIQGKFTKGKHRGKHILDHVVQSLG